jgi:hypothetical protein
VKRSVGPPLVRDRPGLFLRLGPAHHHLTDAGLALTACLVEGLEQIALRRRANDPVAVAAGELSRLLARRRDEDGGRGVGVDE